MKLRILPLLTAVLFLICLSFLGYRFSQWWQLQQKKKALFLHFRTKSPFTKKMPEDAFAYINLYDLKRVHAHLHETAFSHVLSHWLDRGMSDNQKANPLLGGMLEKTILDVIGEEFAVSLLPSDRGTPDFVAIGKSTGGSEFFLKLALVSSRKAQRISFRGGTVYQFGTKYLSYPQVYVFLHEDYVYASSNLQRIKRVSMEEGEGPAFLQELNVEAIPEDTILFARVKTPQVSALVYGSGLLYHIQVDSSALFESHLSEIRNSKTDVFRVQTNGPETIGQPATSYMLQAVEHIPASSILLSFPNSERARLYKDQLVSRISNNIPPTLGEDRIDGKIKCFRYNRGGVENYLCHHGANLLMASGEPALKPATSALTEVRRRTLPLTLKIEFHPELIRDYFQKAKNREWERFEEAKEFYFLSCLKEITGSIDESQKEITVELH